MAEKQITISVDEELYRRFCDAATDKQGSWRSSHEPLHKAFDGAISVALHYFVQRYGPVPNDAIERKNLASRAVDEIKAWSEKLYNLLRQM